MYHPFLHRLPEESQHGVRFCDQERLKFPLALDRRGLRGSHARNGGGRREEHVKSAPIYHPCAIFPETQYLATKQRPFGACQRGSVWLRGNPARPAGSVSQWPVPHMGKGAPFSCWCWWGSPWGHCISGMSFSLVSGSVGAEGLRVTLRLPALIAGFSPPPSRWAPAPPTPRMTDSGRRG